MAEETGVVKYTAKDGQEITLGFEIVRKYLVQGKRDLVTPQELMFFMGICKSRGLNPFKKDVYLIKYSDDPAALVTSIDFFRSRAKAQKDCRGWKAGIVIQKKESLEYREGHLLLEGEKLVGGWFEAKPEGWEFPKKHTVNLKPYIKKTRDGQTTRFWQEDNQPMMIMKVAEGQGLRMLWPDEFQGEYVREEIQGPTPDVSGAMTDASEAAGAAPELAIPEGVDIEDVKTFIEASAKNWKMSKEQITLSAQTNLENFWKGFHAWKKKQDPPAKTDEKKKPSNGGAKCPETQKAIDADVCASCSMKAGCPVD